MYTKNYYCKGDGSYHYKSELPKTLQPFVDYVFSSGSFTGDDFNSFNTKYHNVIKKLLPEGYIIHTWHKNHYECSCVIKDPNNRFIYLKINDVRYSINEWFSNILIRTMKHDKDWTGGLNKFTTLFTFTEDIKRQY